jgi:GGDEF-like domain
MRIDMLDDRRDVSASVAEVADAVEAELDGLVASVEDRVMARMQVTNGEPSAALHEALRRGVSAAVRNELALLRSEAELPQELPPDMIELARVCADSRWELTGLADAALAGQEAFWDGFQLAVERTLPDITLCWEVVKAARARLRGNPARVTGLFRRAYEREVARVSGIDEDSRLRTVLRALEGEWVDSGELRYDLAGHHIAMVADTSSSLDAVACRTKRQLLRVQAPDGVIWGWLGGRTRISEDDLDALIASQRSADATIAFGDPAEGMAGFAVSHQQAVEARTIAVATDQRAVRFADFRLLIAVLRDDDLANGLIERELGELDRPSERMRELRETLRAYLEHSQSVSSTAAVRRRDRKTIERQLRSAEELIHHRVSDRTDEVLIALRLAEIVRRTD